MKTALLTLLALVAFAANSLLARAALGTGAIDAGGFTALRLVAGAVVLVVLALGVRGRAGARAGSRPATGDGPILAGSWPAAMALFLYAAPFSFAYLSLTAATGALVLFAAVQITMIGSGLARGERPGPLEWAGLAIAAGGLVYLVLPGLAAPPPVGSALMATAGAAWGIYSLAGRGRRRPAAPAGSGIEAESGMALPPATRDAVAGPVAATAGNFVRAAPLGLGVAVVSALAGAAVWTPRGALLAVVSGAVTSGLGYAVWYAALPGLSATRAATVQLSVPVLTAFGGVVLLGEPVTVRLVVASVLILGGVGAALRGRQAES